MKNKKIPAFKDLRSEAKFWDNHDAGEYLGEFTVSKGVYKSSGKTKTTMTIRLDPGLKRQIEKVADNYDISSSSLVRMWAVDRLRTIAQ